MSYEDSKKNKKNKKNKKIIKLGIGAFILIILGSIGMSCLYDIENFFKNSVFDCINSLVAIIFAYYLTNINNDKRKLKEKVEWILNKIYNEIDKPIILKFNSENDIKEILSIHRNIANSINSLLKIAKILEIEDSMNYINERFNEYREFFGDHVNDLEYLEKSTNKIMKDVKLIQNKIQDIIIDLYLI